MNGQMNKSINEKNGNFETPPILKNRLNHHHSWYQIILSTLVGIWSQPPSQDLLNGFPLSYNISTIFSQFDVLSLKAVALHLCSVFFFFFLLLVRNRFCFFAFPIYRNPYLTLPRKVPETSSDSSEFLPGLALFQWKHSAMLVAILYHILHDQWC